MTDTDSDDFVFRAKMPEGTHMANADGDPNLFLGALLDDETNRLVGQAKFYREQVENEHNEPDPDGYPSNDGGGGGGGTDDGAALPVELVLVVALALATGIITGAVVAVKQGPAIARWWNQHVASPLRSRWSQLAAKFTSRSKPSEALALLSAQPVTTAEFSHEITLAATPSATASAEAQQRLLAALLASAFAAEQFRLLGEAQISDWRERRAQLDTASRGLATTRNIDLANKLLERTDAPIDRRTREALHSTLGGGTHIDGVYVPIELPAVRRALRTRPA